MVAADHLGELADHLIGHFVDQARRSGASWTDIGRAMGVTKQAARKRFMPKDPGDPTDLDADDGFSRFTPRAAQRRRRRPRRGPRRRARRDPPGPPRARPAQRARRARGPGDRRHRRHRRRRPRGRHRRAAARRPTAGPELVPYGPAAKKVLELTFREALRLGHNYIGTEHVLLALLEAEDGDGVLTDSASPSRRSSTSSPLPSPATPRPSRPTEQAPAKGTDFPSPVMSG